MKRILALVVSLFAISSYLLAQPKADDYEWMKSIRSDHPRLFFTVEDIPQIVTAANSFESRLFRAMQKRIDKLIEKAPVFKNELAVSGEKNNVSQYGYRTAEAAMVWIVTRDTKYLDFAKRMMDRMIRYYELRLANDLNINWYSFTVTSMLCAYDWIYNDLTVEEREDFGRRLYNATYNIAWHGPGLRNIRYRENPSKPANTGFYGSSVLPWYVGLTFYGEGLNDKECERMLCNGYRDHCTMSSYRANLLGENGGCSSGTIGYGLGAYPYAEYNFIYTFRSATGIDITPQMSYMIGYLRYMDWCRLPGNCEFGIGDANHSNNKLPRMVITHINEIANLFGKSHPEVLDWGGALLSRYNDSNFLSGTMPFIPLLHRYNFESSEVASATDAKDKQSIRFESIGQIIMRSGVSDNDTYAVFLTERSNNMHQHFDINHFTIFKYGYRALDSGTRPQPGLHLSHYYARTVAHNCITIRMEGEEMPKYWGGAAPDEDGDTPIPNEGGQRNSLKGKLLAYEESADYVYIASDATECYHKAKAEQVVREFVWIKPDIFVIYDRVVSDKAEYPKKWLYHIASEPVMNGKAEFAEISQGGKSICRTLLPKGAVLKFVGGEGKQFWADGKNWAISDYAQKWIPQDNHPLVGQWRVEVSPKKSATHDHFLHIIQVGNESLAALPKTKCEDGKESVTLSFDYAAHSYTLTFDKTKQHGCTIVVGTAK